MSEWIDRLEREPPKDGSKFVVVTATLREFELAGWYVNVWYSYVHFKGDHYTRITHESGHFNCSHFTHWMPLPAPPEQ